MAGSRKIPKQTTEASEEDQLSASSGSSPPLSVGTLMETYQRLPPTEVTSPQAEEGFDFSTRKIHQWEVDAIRSAMKNDELDFRPHAVDEFRKDGINLTYDLPDIIARGQPTEKDLPNDEKANRRKVRQPGINFEHTLMSGMHVRVKISYEDGYWVVTGHKIERRR